MRIGNDVHQTANPFIGNGICLCVLFWKLSLHTSDCALVISRWLDAAHNRPPNAPAAPVSADSVPYQQSLPWDSASSSRRTLLLQSTRPGTTVQKWQRPQSVSFAPNILFFLNLRLQRLRRLEDAERLWRHPWHKRMPRVDERERPNSLPSQ